jgi:hypothetical protein
MGKRSNFERKKKDLYKTIDPKSVERLSKYVSGSYIEPCAGDGSLIRLLDPYGLTCDYACDIEPMATGIEQLDVLFFGSKLPPCDKIITNPPWERKALHAMINLFRNHAPTWLLFDAGWMFCEQAKPFLTFCSRIVSVGRLYWEEKHIKGMEDCCWYEFGKEKTKTEFINK